MIDQPPPQTRPPEPMSVRVILAIDRTIYAIARRWVLWIDALMVTVLAAAVAAPLFGAGGHRTLATILYTMFRPLCHQRDDRSFHLNGEKMACCERCAAIYAGMALFGLLFLIARGRIARLGWRGFALAALPMAIDGLTQLIGLRESSTLLRVLTGALFGIGLVWLLLPYLEVGFADMRAQLERRFARLVAQGRTRPLAGAPPGS